MKNEKGSSSSVAAVAIVVLVLIAVGVFFFIGGGKAPTSGGINVDVPDKIDVTTH